MKRCIVNITVFVRGVDILILLQTWKQTNISDVRKRHSALFISSRDEFHRFIESFLRFIDLFHGVIALFHRAIALFHRVIAWFDHFITGSPMALSSKTHEGNNEISTVKRRDESLNTTISKRQAIATEVHRINYVWTLIITFYSFVPDFIWDNTWIRYTDHRLKGLWRGREQTHINLDQSKSYSTIQIIPEIKKNIWH